MSSDWTCAEHGRVAPYHATRLESLAQVAASAKVPVWAPFPLIPGWTLGGLGWCGDERSGATATVLALAGPSPIGGPADLLLVAEEPGTGLGASLAGGRPGREGPGRRSPHSAVALRLRGRPGRVRR
jgi:hypothetical protein